MQAKPYTPKFEDNEFRCNTSHYKINAGDKAFIYAYIRKNACSSFKSLINRRPHPSFLLRRLFGYTRGRRLSINDGIAYFRTSKYEATSKRGHTNIFVYRDPLSRFVSIFLNKFVDQNGAIDISNNYENIFGKTVHDSNFIDFIEYSNIDFSRLDCHLWPQKSHLWDLNYLAIPQSNLLELMRDLIGTNTNLH